MGGEVHIHDKNGGYYRTALQTDDFKDASSKYGTIGNTSIELINYGAPSKDALRIYLSARSLEEMKDIFETLVSLLETVSTKDFQAVYDKINNTNGESFEIGSKTSGYYVKNGSAYDLLIDFNGTFKPATLIEKENKEEIDEFLKIILQSMLTEQTAESEPQPEPVPEPEPEPEPEPDYNYDDYEPEEESSGQTVYVSKKGVIHSVSDCSGMKNYRTMSLTEAESKGYKYCSNCW